MPVSAHDHGNYVDLLDSIPRITDRIIDINRRLSELAYGLTTISRRSEESDQAFASRVRSLQNRVNQLMADAGRLRELEATLGERCRDPHVELEAIGELHGVTGVTVSNTRISVFATVVYEYGKTRYDFGDWRIEIDPHEESIKAHELRRGYKEASNPPVYRVGTCFCFGGNDADLQDMVESRFYLEAVSAALSLMGAVNRGEEYLVPQYFRKVGEQAVAGELLAAD